MAKSKKRSSYKGKHYDPNYNNKSNNESTTRALVLDESMMKLKALGGQENTKEPEYGEKIKPKIGGVLDEGYGYINLWNIAIADDFDFDDINNVLSDSSVKAYRNKLLGSASSYKRSYDFNDVADEVAEFSKDLYNKLAWDDYHRYTFSAGDFKYAVIQVLWENVDYELIGDKLYPKEQRIYGFKQEDIRNFAFNVDETLGNYGDTIFTPTNTNITRDYPYNFIVVRNKPDFQNIEGVSELKELKNLILLKKFLLKTQARYVKKATVPSFVAIYKSNKTGDALSLEASAIASNLSGIEGGAGIALPNIDDIVSLMPVAQTDFIKILSYINGEIQLRLLGTTLLGGQDESGGSYASAKVGATELEDAIKQVALILQNADNIVIKFAIWQRFGTETKLPQLLFDLSEKATIEQLKLMFETGLPVDYTELRRSLPMASGAKEPKDKQWFLGSPDGTLANLPKSDTNIEELSEEEKLIKDAERKQLEEQKKLEDKEL